MIADGFLGIVLSVFRSILGVLPDINLNVDSGLYASFLDMVSGVVYLLPINTIVTIGSIILAILGFRIFIAIPKAIWDLLPFA